MTHTDQVRALVVLLVLNNLFTAYELSIEHRWATGRQCAQPERTGGAR